MKRIAVTGTASFVGARILRRLVEARGPGAVVAIDIVSPPHALGDVRHRMVDLTLPGADRRLVETFEEEEVGDVVHTAFFTDPRRDRAHAHELESIGTLHLAAAAAAAGVKHLLVRSFTAVYGASGQNPAYLTEDRRLDSAHGMHWVRDKLEAEQHAFSFGRRYPGLGVTVLRLAPLLGPGVDSFYTRLLGRRVVPVLLGYDPLVQLLHPADALAAVEAALEHGPAGILNVVPKAPITLLTALHLAEKLTVPVPHPLAYPLADLAWGTGVGEAPAGFVDFARFPVVADGERAQRTIGFEPRYSSHDALRAFLDRDEMSAGPGPSGVLEMGA